MVKIIIKRQAFSLGNAARLSTAASDIYDRAVPVYRCVALRGALPEKETARISLMLGLRRHSGSSVSALIRRESRRILAVSSMEA